VPTHHEGQGGTAWRVLPLAVQGVWFWVLSAVLKGKGPCSGHVATAPSPSSPLVTPESLYFTTQ
jgi:hypothetical protein